VDDPFGDKSLLVERQHHLVGENIVDEFGAGRSCKSQVVDLDGCRTIGQDIRSTTARQAVEVDGDVHPKIVDELGDVAVAVRRNVIEPVECLDEAVPYGARLTRAMRYADDLETCPVVTLEQFCDGRPHRVLPEVR